MAAWQSGTRGEAAEGSARKLMRPPLPLHCGLGTHRSADNEIRRSRLAGSRPTPLARSQDVSNGRLLPLPRAPSD